MTNPGFTNPNATTLNVTLNGSRVIIDWNSFVIGSNETVNFVFPSNSSIVLNRTTGTATIGGVLNGCVSTCATIGGSIWIYAPDGVVFGPGAVVNSGGLLATTAPMTTLDSDFIAGTESVANKFTFAGASSSSLVDIQAGASITGHGGTLAFVAPLVTSETGAAVSTTAPGSTGANSVLYGAASGYTIHYLPDAAGDLDMVDFIVPAGSESTVVTPLSLAGSTSAGNIYVAAVSNVANAMITTSGQLTATTASSVGGDIVLSAGGGISAGAPASASGTAVAANLGPASADHSITVSASGALTLTGQVAVNNAGVLTLTSGGAVTQTAGAITAGTLTGSSAGSASLTNANQIATLGAFNTNGGGSLATAGAFSLTDAQALTLKSGTTLDATGTPSGGNITLATTTGALTLAGSVQTGTANTLTLTSAGAITQTGGTLTAGTLTGQSAGSTTLTDANQIATLGAFNTNGGGTLATAGAFSLTDAQALTLKAGATLDATGSTSGGNITLATTTGALTLAGSMQTGTANTLTLTSAGAISQTGGTITAGTLTGQSAGSTTLTAANLVGTLGAFNTNGGGSLATAGAFSLVDGQALTLKAGTTLDATGSTSGGDIALKTTTGDLTLAGSVQTGTTLTLVSSGAITQSGGVITAGTLTGSSGGSTSLGTLTAPISNQVATLGAFKAGGSLSLTDAQAAGLSVTGSDVKSLGITTGVSAGTNLTLLTTGATGTLTLAGTVSAGASTGVMILISQHGAITQTSGTITSGSLAGHSAGATQLGTAASPIANRIGTLGGFTSGGDFSLTDLGTGQSLEVFGPLTSSGGNIYLATTADLTVDPLQAQASWTIGAPTGAVTLSVGRDLVLEGPIVAGVSGCTGGLSFCYSAGRDLDIDYNLSGVNGSLQAGRDINLGASVTTSGFLALGAGRNIAQSAGVISAAQLTGQSGGSTSLTDANQIGTLGAFNTNGGGSLATAGAFSLVDGQALTLKAGATLDATGSTSGGNITLATTTGALTLAGSVQTGTANTLTLTSAGAITQTGGTLTAGTLAGQSAGSTTLTNANQIATLGAFNTNGGGTLATAGAFSLTDAQALTLKSGTTLDATGTTSGGNITLATTTGALTLAGSIQTGTANTLTLTSAGAINQTGGTITAGTLTGSSVGVTQLGTALSPFANRIATLGAFTSGSDFSLTDTGTSQSLEVAGPLTSTNGNIYLATTNDLTVDPLPASASWTIGAPTGTVTLAVGRDLILEGPVFAGRSGCAGGLSFCYAAGRDLDVDYALSGGSGSLQAGRDINLGASVTTSGFLALGAGRNIAQSAGVISAAQLTGQSGGSTTLTNANQIVELDAFKTGSGLKLVDAEALAVKGTYISTPLFTSFTGVDAGTGDLTLSTNGDLALSTANANLTAGTGGGSQIVTLISGGAITQTGGIITAGMLTGQSSGSTSLTDANLIGTLGAFKAGGSGSSFSLTDALAAGLSITGTDVKSLGITTGVSAGTDIALKTTGSTGTLTLAGTVSTGAPAGTPVLDQNGLPSGVLTLTSSGTIAQTSGVVTAGTLTGSSAGSASLTDANQIGTLGAFNTNGGGSLATAGAFSLTDAQALTLKSGTTLDATGTTSGGNITLATTTGALTLAGSVQTGTANTLILTSAGAINQTGGTLTAGTLTGQSAGSTTLTDANQIATLGAFNTNGGGTLATAGAFSLTDAQALTLKAGATLDATGSTSGGNITLATTTGALTLAGSMQTGTANTLTLTSAGAISQTGGTITAGTLTGQSAGSTTLTAANLVGTLGAFNTNGGGSLATAGAFSLVDGQALTLKAGTTLDATGSTSGGDIALKTTTGDLTLAGSVQTGTTLTLVSSGAITQTGGTITAGTLTGSSGGSTSLGTLTAPISNQVATLGAFKTGTGFSLTDGESLVVTGSDSKSLGFTGIDAGTGDLTLKIGGDLSLSGAHANLTAGTGGGTQTLTLISGGTINQSADGETVVAGVLTGSSVGATSLTNANLIGNLGAFAAGSSFSLTDALAAGLTVTGADVKGLGITTGVTGTNITLKTTGATGTLTLAGTISTGAVATNPGRGPGGAPASNQQGAPTGVLTLTSSGAVTQQPSGIITATTLTGSSVGVTQLGTAASPIANKITTLGAFTSGGDFSLTDTGAGQSLQVVGPLTSTNGGVYLATTSDLGFGGSVTTGASKTVTLASGGAISQTAGVITTGTLTGSAQASAVMNDDNNVGTLQSFSARGDLMFTDAATLVAYKDTAGGTLALTVNPAAGSALTDLIVTDGGAPVANGSLQASNVILIANSGSILIGGASFITAAQAKDGQPATSINVTRGEPPSGTTVAGANEVFIKSGGLTVAASDNILQQNTSLGTGQGAGLIVTTLTIAGAGRPSPQVIDLFGSVDGINGNLAATSAGITSPRNNNFRFDSCVVGQAGACTVLSNAIINIPIDNLTQELLLQDAFRSNDTDPTITGAGNEEIWRKRSSR